MTAADTAVRPSADTRAALAQLAQQLSHVWPIPLIAGVVSFGLGLAIAATDWTVQALVVVVGLLLVVRGLALVFSPDHATASAGEHIVAGVVGVVAGIVLIAWPGPTLLVLAFFLGTWLAVSGGFHIIVAITRRKEMRHWVATLVLGAIELPLGVWVMRRPDVTLNLIVTVVGLWAVLTGVILCVQAFEIRHEAHELKREARTGFTAGLNTP
jgi:uncharacterized membrane protein HdeD (DUF308 family)